MIAVLTGIELLAFEAFCPLLLLQACQAYKGGLSKGWSNLAAADCRGSPSQLQGCINDAHCMRHLLCTRFAFPPQAITMLTDDASWPGAWPTRAKMLWHMQALVAGLQPGDSLVFHFSGHGLQVPDRTGDEDDGMNEALAPCDFREVSG